MPPYKSINFQPLEGLDLEIKNHSGKITLYMFGLVIFPIFFAYPFRDNETVVALIITIPILIGLIPIILMTTKNKKP